MLTALLLAAAFPSLGPTPRETALAVFDAFNQRDLSAMEALYAPDAVLTSSDPPSVWWTPMLAFRSWRGVSDECSTPELSGFFQARGR